MISSVFKTKKLVFVRKGTLFMTAETEAIKAQILSTGNAEILLEENDFLIVKWIKPEIKYSMAAYQYGKTGMANNYPWECSLTEEQIAFFLEHINAAVEYFKSKHHYFHLEVKEVSYTSNVYLVKDGTLFLLYGRKDFENMTHRRYEYIKGLNGHSEIALYVDTFEEVDMAYNNAIKNGATSVLEPELEPWGQRTCYIADPEGNLIEIGSWNKVYEQKDL